MNERSCWLQQTLLFRWRIEGFMYCRYFTYISNGYPFKLEDIEMVHPKIAETVVVSILHVQNVRLPLGLVKPMKGAKAIMQNIKESIDRT